MRQFGLSRFDLRKGLSTSQLSTVRGVLFNLKWSRFAKALFSYRCLWADWCSSRFCCTALWVKTLSGAGALTRVDWSTLEVGLFSEAHTLSLLQRLQGPYMLERTPPSQSFWRNRMAASWCIARHDVYHGQVVLRLVIVLAECRRHGVPLLLLKLLVGDFTDGFLGRAVGE